MPLVALGERQVQRHGERVAGDVLDIATLCAALGQSRRQASVAVDIGSVVVVAAATVNRWSATPRSWSY